MTRYKQRYRDRPQSGNGLPESDNGVGFSGSERCIKSVAQKKEKATINDCKSLQSKDFLNVAEPWVMTDLAKKERRSKNGYA